MRVTINGFVLGDAYKGEPRPLRGLWAQLDHQPHDQGAVRARCGSPRIAKIVGHRLLVEDACSS